jgi:hypothetical protein
MQIIGYVSEVTEDTVICSKCGCELRNDHGWALDNGEFICKYASKCSLRVARNRWQDKQASGEKLRWKRV